MDSERASVRGLCGVSGRRLVSRLGLVLLLGPWMAVPEGGGSSWVRGNEINIDPQGGLDSMESGSRSSPLRTLSFALNTYLEFHPPGEHLILRLRPGIYRGGDSFEALPETLPWRIPSQVRAVKIVGAGDGGSGARVELVDPQLPAFEFEPSGEEARRAVPVELELVNLHFRGARSALTVIGPQERPLHVSVDSCAFAGIPGSGLEVFAGPRSRCSLIVANCRFDRCATGISVEALGASEATLEVRDNRFAEVPPLGPEGLLGGAIELHADAGARVAGRFLRNVFRDTTNGLLVTASEEAADFQALVANNLFYSTRSPFCDVGEVPELRCGTRHALYFSVPAQMRSDVRLINNTLVGVDRQVVFDDSAQEVDEIGIRLHAANNIFWGSEGLPPGSVAGDGGRLPPGFRLERNLVPESWLADLENAGGGGENLSADPLFADFERGDFRLLGGSLAVDAGDSGLTQEIGGRDLAGNCRRTTSAGNATESEPPFPVDLGAYEFPGLCDPALRLSFVRADCNTDGSVELTDGVASFMYLFLGTNQPRCLDACDSNDSGSIDITDGIYTLTYLFLGGSSPPEPFPAAGGDPSPDSLPDCLNAED